MELTLRSVKGELAALYFINILGSIFLPAAALAAYLLVRLQAKVTANKLMNMQGLDDEQSLALVMLTSHIAWLKNLYKIFFIGIAVSALITFFIGNVFIGVGLLFGLFTLFFLMSLAGYFKVLIDKPIAYKEGAYE